mgnify:CR=1 FL=1
MRKLLLTSVAAMAMGTFAATHAQAADLYVPAPPPPEPVWSWAGPYAGLHVGALDGDIDDNFDTFFEGKQPEPVVEVDSASINADSMDPNGIMGGIQAGYNFQFDSIVLGVEGDVSLGDVDDTIYPFLFSPAGRIESQIDWMATIRARLGWAMDRTLFYVTGGMAFTDLELKVEDGFTNFKDKDSQSMFGWTIGGGVEHAVTDHISLKAEYLYADFGKEDFKFSSPRSPDIRGKVDLDTHTFRVGVNYLF